VNTGDGGGDAGMRESYPAHAQGCQQRRGPVKLSRMGSSARESASSSHAHLVAEFTGVALEWLGDGARLGGLLVAAAGAAGLHALGAPFVRTSGAHGVDAMLLLEGGHAALHAVPARRVVLVDLLAPIQHDLVPAFDVLSRRLAITAVHAQRLLRG